MFVAKVVSRWPCLRHGTVATSDPVDEIVRRVPVEDGEREGLAVGRPAGRAVEVLGPVDRVEPSDLLRGDIDGRDGPLLAARIRIADDRDLGPIGRPVRVEDAVRAGPTAVGEERRSRSRRPPFQIDPFGVASSRLVNAIRVPSGDHDGPVCSPGMSLAIAWIRCRPAGPGTGPSVAWRAVPVEDDPWLTVLDGHRARAWAWGWAAAG